jgi:hypothetical protein
MKRTIAALLIFGFTLSSHAIVRGDGGDVRPSSLTTAGPPANNATMSNTKTVAYHEAGHAVVARVLGIGVPYVTLLPGEVGVQRQSARWLAKDDADRSVMVRAIENDAKISLAGMCAQLKYRPRTDERRMRSGGWLDDIKQAKSCVAHAVHMKSGGQHVATETAVEVDHDEFWHLYEQLKQETMALVEANWPAIERTAEALLRSRALVQDDIDALIAGSKAEVGRVSGGAGFKLLP